MKRMHEGGERQWGRAYGNMENDEGKLKTMKKSSKDACVRVVFRIKASRNESAVIDRRAL